MKNTTINKHLILPILIVFNFLICSFSPLTLRAQADKSPESLKIIQFTDVHIDKKNPILKARMYPESIKLLKAGVDQANAIKDTDLVVFSGDLVNTSNKDDLFTFMKTANKLDFPWIATTGNHDIGISGGISKSEFIKLLSSHNLNINSNKTYYSYVPKKGYIVICLDGVIDKIITANGMFDNEQLKWLDKTLTEYKKSKAIIVQHFPIVEPYASLSHKVLNGERYMDVIKKHQNVIAILSGHYHATKVTKVGNIVHISTPALIEYPNAFRVIKINDNGKKIEIKTEVVETSLKDVQEKSKSLSRSPELSRGHVQDRNVLLYVDSLNARKSLSKTAF
jgi:3',5'-cyclic AMP phosphodiesterase CpdA